MTLPRLIQFSSATLSFQSILPLKYALRSCTGLAYKCLGLRPYPCATQICLLPNPVVAADVVEPNVNPVPVEALVVAGPKVKPL